MSLPPELDAGWPEGRAGDLISLHAPDGTVTVASDSCRALLGVPSERLVGGSLGDHTHPHDRAALTAAPTT